VLDEIEAYLGNLDINADRAIHQASSILRLFKYKGKAVKRRPFIR
jgi:hypothetical protein